MAFLLVAFLVAYLPCMPLACTLVAVGKDASASGHPIVAHTDDSGASTTDIRFVRVPRQSWPAGSMRPLHFFYDGYPRVVDASRSPEYAPANGQKESIPIGKIPQVPETFAYWDMDYGVQNERGLSIGESTCTSRTVGWPAMPDTPYGYNRVGIEELSKIALERCETARCAATTMGEVAVDQGFYSADSGNPASPDYSDSAEALVIADAGGEMWIFNVMTGKNNASAIWAAKRVPPGDVVAIGNSFTIRKMNLSDPANFLYSPGVTSLAEEMGWWSPAEEEHPGVFDFMGAYGYSPKDAFLSNVLSFYSGRRMWRIFSLLSPGEGAKLDPNLGNLPKTRSPYPSSVPAPRGSVTASMVMGVLRDHYEGTPYDLTQGMAAGPFGNPNRGPVTPRNVSGLWERAISMHRGSWSYVLEAKPLGLSVSWLGLDAPHGTAYLPFFGSATEGAPQSFHSHEGYMSKFSTKVAWWAFNLVNQYTDLNYGLISKDVKNKSQAIEADARRQVAEWEAQALADPENAAALLTSRSNAFAQASIDEWFNFGWSLFAKFGRYTITYNESENGMGLQAYPEWFLQSPEVGFSSWNPLGPFHGFTLSAANFDMQGSARRGGALDMPSSSIGGAVLALVVAMAFVFAAYAIGVKHGKTQQVEDLSIYISQP